MGLYLLNFFIDRSSCWSGGWARGKVSAIYAVGVAYDSCAGGAFFGRERDLYLSQRNSARLCLFC